MTRPIRRLTLQDRKQMKNAAAVLRNYRRVLLRVEAMLERAKRRRAA